MTKELATPLAEVCADMVNTFTDENKREMSDAFVSIWNHAIKMVTPLEFCQMICQELKKDEE